MKLGIPLAFIAALLSVAGTFPSSVAEDREIPAGTLRPFWLGPTEREGKNLPRKPIPIGAFKSMVHAVTNETFIAFLNERPEWRKSAVSPLFADLTYLSQFKSDFELKDGISPKEPVTFVSWFAARAYCEHRGARLPTMNEWEYMAAASESKADATGDPEFLARILEWYSRTRETLPAANDGFRNHYGIKGLHGMIWEWVEDFNSIPATGESRADGSLNRDLFCGGGGLAGGDKENYAAFMRFAFRTSLKGKSAVWNLGFRCVR